MNQSLLSLIVLAGIAIFLVVRLRNVLGTREGFEKPPVSGAASETSTPARFEVIENEPDRDIVDNVEAGTQVAQTLTAMKLVEPSFSVNEFLRGARGAYEMILMAFERGDMDSVKPFLSEDVFEAFSGVVDDRKAKGLRVEAEFVGLRELQIIDAELHRDSQEGEIKVRFVGEITYAVYDNAGTLVDGSVQDIKRQKDIWTFARAMGKDDPNWQLVATGA
ncbi:Tim44-like domain protein [Aquimixticola soesokkakensis]|uniref:Tim44-like domain protein n=1 Tax=Aquimixticola soesokkakensis TaxID=1519096 RepID=A0A1Y5R8Y0_9RHOB|nr:Tim44/TimA family putative adaptor protein [Aquimixticola soesokkakensis]SLN11904.1 Tim44-like domain protein [Aquimixticola soesokkakensis]